MIQENTRTRNQKLIDETKQTKDKIIKIWFVCITDKITSEIRYNRELFDYYKIVFAEFEKCSGRGMRHDQCTVHLNNECEIPQIKARNKYLKQVPNSTSKKSNWMVILDSDEIIFPSITDIRKTIEDMDSRGFIRGDILELRSDFMTTGKIELRPRIIKKLRGMKYKRKHDRIYYKGENILSPEYPAPRLLHIGFLHNKVATEGIAFEPIQYDIEV